MWWRAGQLGPGNILNCDPPAERFELTDTELMAKRIKGNLTPVLARLLCRFGQELIQLIIQPEVKVRQFLCPYNV